MYNSIYGTAIKIIIKISLFRVGLIGSFKLINANHYCEYEKDETIIKKYNDKNKIHRDGIKWAFICCISNDKILYWS